MRFFLVVSSPCFSRFGWLINVSPLSSYHCYQCYNQPWSNCSKCSPLVWRDKSRRLSKPSTVFSKVIRENHLGNWPEGYDDQGDVHLKILSTFVKHLEHLFTSKNQDNSEKGHLVVSQTFDLKFLPFQGHKTIFSHVIFDVKFPDLFKSAVKNKVSYLRKGSYLHLILKIELKVKCPPRSWSTFVRTIFCRFSILEDIWDYRLK